MISGVAGNIIIIESDFVAKMFVESGSFVIF